MIIEIGKHRRKRRKNGKRGFRYWVISVTAMGAIVAFTVDESRAMNIALAKRMDDAPAAVAPAAAARFAAGFSGEGEEETPRPFNIPTGTLKEVIEAFVKITGWSVSVPESIQTIPSAGASGNFSDEEALRRILANTGVTFDLTGLKTAALRLLGPNETVEIVAEQNPLSSPKYTAPLRDVPQTITVIPKEVIDKQGATTLREVLTNVPGITLTAGEGGAPAGDNLTIRGFSARNDIYVDGVRDLGPQSRDPFNLEQVEVVKGPSSSFTGRGSTGGTINLVSKLPNLRRSISGSFALGTDETKRGTVDLNLPVTDSIAFRLNAVGHDSAYAGREAVKFKRYGIAPSISFGLGTASRYSFGYFHLEQNNVSDYGIPWVPATNNALSTFRDRPAPVPRNTFYGFADRDKEKLGADLVTFRYEHEFNDRLTVRNQLRYGRSTRDSIATPPRFVSNNSTAINRELRSWITKDDIWDNQTDFTARFNTGSVQHSAVFGTSLTYEKNIRTLRTGANAVTTLLNPNPNDVYTGVITTSPFVGEAVGKTFAVYGFDTIKFNKYFEFVGGLRWDRFDVDGLSAATTGLTPVKQTTRLLSGRAALVYKPIEAASIYASYGTALNPSLEGLSYGAAVNTTTLEPEKTNNYELGAKWGFFDSRLLLTGAIFRVEKTNARTPGINPSDPPIVLDGEQRVDGIELSATGNISRNWQIFAGYTLLDSRIVKSNTAPTLIDGLLISEVGKELINTPRHSFNLYSTYAYKKLFFGGGPRFVDKRFGNNINTRYVDSYWLVDAVASYQITKKINLRVNAYNLTDKYYFSQIAGGHVVPGAGRSILLSTGFGF
jgi:catecholate siderophore receptor